MNGTQVAGYSYDDDGRLTTLSTTAGDFGFEYDRLSRRSRIAFPNGVATEYSYDTQSRLTSVQAGGGGVVGTTYVHDAVGNRTSKASASQSEAYSYDASDRLTAVSSAAGMQLFAYDRVGNRLTIQRDGILQRANYDQRNRLTELASGDGSLQVRGTLDEAGAVAVDGKAAAMVGPREFKAQVQVAPGENTLAIDAWDQSGNQITQHYRVTQPSSSSSMEYDPNGNLLKTTQGGPVTQFEWDAENRLIRVSRDGTELARFSYDPLGRRTQKIAGGVTYSFVYDGQDILSETHNDGTTYTYVHGPGIDEPLARLDQSGAVAYYHADGLGSIVATTDAAGNVTSRRQYDAWGNLEVGADQAGYAFTGREWDPETGLYYYRARYYDPRIGRFISEDPLRFAAGPNFYAYVDGNPANFRDPRGLDGTSWLEGFALGGASAGVVGSAVLVIGGTAAAPVVIGGLAVVGGVAIVVGAVDLLTNPEATIDDADRFSGGIAGGFVAGAFVGQGVPACKGTNPRVNAALRGVEEWLGGDGITVRTNAHGDKIFLSADQTLKFRADLDHTYPHQSPHMHLEALVNGAWQKSGPIYPANVPKQ